MTSAPRHIALRSLALTAALVASTVTVTTAGAGENGTCVSAEIPFAFALPDGSTHDAGTLRMCVERSFTPVQTIHAVAIAGRPVGLVLSRRTVAEATDAAEPILLFNRRGDEPAVLLGYSVPMGRRSVAYRLDGAKDQALWAAQKAPLLSKDILVAVSAR